MNEASLELAVTRAPYVDFFLSDPDAALVERVHAGGARCGWQIESAEEARAAADAGCDLVVAKAWESGGRKRIEGPALLPLLDAVLDAVDAPVLAAGGIATARGVAAALAAGADGVRVGTRFIAAAEADAHPEWVEGIVRARASDAVVSTAYNVGLPEPGPHRVLRSSIEAAEALPDDEIGVVRLAGAEIPVRRFAAQPPTRESTGAVAAMPFYAGQSAGAVRGVQPAAEIVAELAAGVTRA
jgi:NAD(P)H-dependent flavin oxidoreductase YrpB (nitropropane dioxygenase family)